MTLVLSGTTILSLLLAAVATAGAETCSGRARNCVAKWGGPETACYAALRLAACEKTGKYVAPNGNVWPATRMGKPTDGQG
jgi:hypothetical protein